jgi:hypothetical protein
MRIDHGIELRWKLVFTTGSNSETGGHHDET